MVAHQCLLVMMAHQCLLVGPVVWLVSTYRWQEAQCSCVHTVQLFTTMKTNPHVSQNFECLSSST